MKDMLMVDTEEVVDEDVVAVNGEEDTEEDPMDRNVDVVDPKENVIGEASNAIHMVTFHIQVVCVKQQRQNTRIKKLLQIYWEATRLTAYDMGKTMELS